MNTTTLPAVKRAMLAAYNAGDSRAIEWNRVAPGARPLTEQNHRAYRYCFDAR